MSSPNFHHPVSFCSALLFFLALITPVVISWVPRGRNVVLLIFNIWNIDRYVQKPNSYFWNEWVYTRGCASIYFHLFNQLFQAPFLVQVLWAYIERHPLRCQEAAYFGRDRNGMDLEKNANINCFGKHGTEGILTSVWQAWWYLHAISDIQGLRKKDHKFEPALATLARPCLEIKIKERRELQLGCTVLAWHSQGLEFNP